MAESKIIVAFKILEKKIGELDVAGLSEFWVDPRGQGVGKKALHFVEAIADPKPVVGFADADVVGFYQACEWYVGPVIAGKHIVMSEPIDISKFSGETW